jgi:hypothetical protein
MGDQNPMDFAEKVLQSLKKSSRAVDLNEPDVQEEQNQVSAQSVDRDFSALGSVQAGGQGPGAGGFKDLVVIPGYSGTAATSVSQVNFYWSAPTTPDATGTDLNIRSTIYNYATNPGSGVTYPVLVFGGYNGATHYKPHPLYGGGSGVTAKIWLDPFLGKIDVDYIGLNITAVGATSDAGVMSYDSTQNKVRVGTGSGSAKTVAFTDDIPATAAIASTSYSSVINSNNTSGVNYLLFTYATSGSGLGLSADSNLQYNPGTNILTATAFAGSLTGNVTGFASTAYSVSVNTTSAAGNHYITVTPTGTSAAGAGQSIVTSVYVTPSTGTVTASAFSGPLTGNVTGFASTAYSVSINTTSAAGNHYITVTPTSTSAAGAGQSIVTSVYITPSTGTLTASAFAGPLTGAVTGNVTGNLTGFATTAYSTSINATTASGNHYLTVTPTGTSAAGAGQSIVTAVYVTPSTGTITASAFSGPLTGNVTGFATTAQNINVVNSTSSSDHYLLFSPTATGSGIAVSSDTTLKYVPSTDTLYATNFVGTVTGTISGVASTAASLVVNATSASGSHYIMISPSPSGSGIALSTDSTFTINPSTNAVSVGTGSVTANGVVLGSASNTINTSSGNLTIDSNGGTTNISDNVTITGNLTVQGTTTTVDSTISTIVDPILVIGSGAGGTHSTLDDNKDRGIEFRWSNSGTATTGFFGFDDSTGKFTFIPNGANSSEVFSGAAGTAVFATVEATLSGNAAGTAATYTNFYGNITGNVTGNVTGFATTAYSLSVNTTTAAGNHYFTVTPTGSSAAGAGQSIVTAVYVTPSTGTITATAFSGPLTGAVTGNVTGFATTAYSVSINTTSSAGNHYITVTPTSTSAAGAGQSIVTAVYVTPSTGTVTASAFAGPLTGAVTGNVTGNLTGFATTAYSTSINTTTASGNHYFTVTPTGTNAAGAGQSIVTAVYVTPSTGTITATAFSGPLTGAVTGNLTGFATTAYSTSINTTSAAGNHYITVTPTSTSAAGAGQSIVSAVYVTPSTGTITATAFAGSLTGNVTGFATTAYSTSINTTTAAGNHYFTVTPTSTSAAGAGQSIVTSVYVTPSTGTVTASAFSGPLTGAVTGNVTGNVTGFATTAQNLNVVSTASSGTHYLLFSAPASGSGVAVSTDSSLTYVPSTDTLSITNVEPTTVTSSSALSNGTYLTIKTNASDDSTTTDYFIRGITSGSVSKFSVDAAGNLRATTKSFDIEHPTKPGYRLVYGVLEGPEHGVYHRGTVEGKGNIVINLPEYWSELVNEDYTVSLTPHGNYGVHIVEKSANSFIISANTNFFNKIIKNIKVDYLVHGSRKDAPLEIEQKI